METSVSLLIGRYVHKLNGLIGLIRAEIKVLQIGKTNLLKQDETLAAALGNIEDLATQVLSLTDEFKLSFVSPQAGDFVSIKAILSQALRDSAPPESIETVLEIDDEIPDVQATKSLVDVFRNLITNAIEAMSDGGRLHVSAKINQAKNGVEIVVTDTGKGIPSYVADSLLFQPYFSTKDQKGHGLGLWWSKMYLESIGGQIALLSSEVGKGTSFLVSLPLP